jgi:hypothetical protein
MLSHSHADQFCMGLCSSCGEKLNCHTALDKEKQSKHKKQFNLKAVLWHSQNRNPHIKRENRKKLIQTIILTLLICVTRGLRKSELLFFNYLSNLKNETPATYFFFSSPIVQIIFPCFPWGFNNYM